MTVSELDLQRRLERLIAEHDVPGAAAGILFGADITEAAAGSTNLNTGVEVTTDTIFQIGSITKVYTASLVMRLVDAGKVDLDTPITRYLPEVSFGDPTVNDVLTARHFMSHTSGLEGDHFEDFGRGDDSIERYVAALSALPQLHAPCANLSYCNAGWVLLGRLVERLYDQPFHQAFATQLAQPAGLADTVLLAEDAILRRVAVGHVPTTDGEGQVVAPAWSLGHASAPAGSLTCATAADVLRFARLHLDEGRAADGAQVLSPAAVHAMQEPQAELPDKVTYGDALGLGWFLMDWDGKRVIGHDGGTIGQAAFLRICPEANLAVSLVTNGGSAREVFRTLFDEIFSELAGVRVPPRPRPLEDASAVDLARYAGTYTRHNATTAVKLEGHRLMLHVTLAGPLAALMPQAEPAELLPTGNDVFVASVLGSHMPVVFYDFDADGRPGWVHLGARAHRRVR